MLGFDVKEWLAENAEIETIFACICDLNGVMRGKRIPADQLDKIINGSLRMPLSLLGMDIWGEDIEGNELVFDTGDADGVCDFTGLSARRDLRSSGCARKMACHSPAIRAALWPMWSIGSKPTG